MLRVLTTTSIIGLMAAPAIAQEVTFADVGVDFTMLTDGDFDVSITNFNGDVEFSIDQFVLGAEIYNTANDNAGNPSTTAFSGFAGYAITSEIMVGAGLTSFSEKDDFFEGDFSGYDVFGQYDAGTFAVAANYAVPNSDNDDFSLTTLYGQADAAPGASLSGYYEMIKDFDSNLYGLGGDYQSGPVSVRASYQAITDDIASLFGVNGAYALNDQLSLTGGFGTGDSFGSEFTSISAGVDYAIMDGVVAEGSISSVDFNGDDITGLSIDISYALGDRQRLDRDIRDQFAADRTALSGGLFVDQGIGAGFGL